MRRCPHCHRRIETSAIEPPSVCPHCGEELPSPEETREWSSVARLSNLAEVGYFDWLLQSYGIPARVHERDDFDAVDGGWHKAFVLQVPDGHALEASRVIEAELEQAATSDEAAGTADGEEQDTQVLFWPLALILVAGGLVYLADRGALPFVRPAEPVTRRDTLWNAIKELPVPLVTDGAAGNRRRALYFDRQRQSFVLQDDIDGDGFFDRRREFNADGIAVDAAR